MVPLKERLSLEWLNEVKGPRTVSIESDVQRQVGAPGLEDALLAYGNRLLRAIQKNPASPAKTARLHDLVTQLGLNLTDALPVVQYLIKRGHLRMLEDDPLGNYLLYLTDQGEQLIS